MAASSSSCSCKSNQKVTKKRWQSSALLGVFIAILPKCPFCILTYSSALTLCSGATVYDHAPGWTSYISILLVLVTLFLILLNRKGAKTYWAAAAVLIGGAMITYSELYTGSLSTYYWGTTILIIGVWINGSFSYFYRTYFYRLIPKSWRLWKPLSFNTLKK